MNNSTKPITLIDGGMGQELLRRSGATPSPLWSAQVMIDYPEIVRDLHADFITAGARVITLNTYSVTPERLARDADESMFESLQLKAIEIAKSAREQAGIEGVQIAGCLPPLVASYRPDQAPGDKVMLETYQRIVAIEQPHVDLFMCETMASIREARAALVAANASELPVWVGLTVADDGTAQLRNGDELGEAVKRIDEIGAAAKLLNCSKPEAIDAAWQALCSGTGPVGAYANGFTSISALKPGGTVGSLQARHDLGPNEYADFAMRWVEQGAAIVGGCCEVGPAHIKTIAQRLGAAGYQL